MTAIIKFTPISGAKNEDPLCYLLEVDDVRILLDCGWNETFDIKLLDNLKSIAKTIDIVLVTYQDIAHLGALPYAFGKLGLKAQVFSTIPVFKMGQMFMYDAFLSRQNSQDFEDVFTLDDVDLAFDHFIQLKYSQHYLLSGKGAGIEITPYAAGHMLGGTIWKIKKEAEEIIYAVDYNHKKERHLNPTLLETLTRPSLLITDALCVFNTETKSRRDRDQEFFDSIVNTLKRDGNVLLPTDTAGRSLELLVSLEQYWSYFKYQQWGLAFLTHVAFNTVEFAKGLLEWMSDAIQKKFDNNRENTFNFSYVKVCHTLEDLDLLPKPLVVLCSFPSLEFGYSRDLFVRWCINPNNLIIFTDRGMPNTLARRLMQQPTPKRLVIGYWQRIPLEGDELLQYEIRKRKEKEEKMALQREKEEKVRRAKELTKMHDEEGEDVESATSLYNLWQSYDLYPEFMKYQFGGRNEEYYSHKQIALPTNNQRQHSTLPQAMFPYIEHRALYDDYGEIIRIEDYAMGTTGDEIGMPMKRKKPGLEQTMEIEETTKAPPPEAPTKCVFRNIEVEVNCAIKYIDFEGRSDGRSIKKIITHVNPRKLILIHGTNEAIEHLREYCERNILKLTPTATQQNGEGTPANQTATMNNEITSSMSQPQTRPQKQQQLIFTPNLNETVDVTSETNIWKLRLKENLLESLNFVKIGDYSIAYVDGVVTLPSVAAQQNTESRTDSVTEHTDTSPILDMLPPDQKSSHPAIFVGDIKLSDFKTLLQQQGFKVELKFGILFVNGVVAVKKEDKEGRSNITIEGNLCEDYFKIRDIVYSQFKIL